MINKTVMYGCQCDNCGEQWIDEERGYAFFEDKNTILNEVRNFELWHTEKINEVEEHYCPDCFKVSEEDELLIDLSRRIDITEESNLEGYEWQSLKSLEEIESFNRFIHNQGYWYNKRISRWQKGNKHSKVVTYQDTSVFLLSFKNPTNANG